MLECLKNGLDILDLPADEETGLPPEDSFGAISEAIKPGRDCLRGPDAKFHQECVGRDESLAFVTTPFVQRRQGNGDIVRRLKDIRHLLCDECLKALQGSLETMYSNCSGELPEPWFEVTPNPA